MNPAAHKRLVAAGAQLKAFPPAVMEACWKATNKVLDDVAAQNATFKKVYDNFVPAEAISTSTPRSPISRWTAQWRAS